MARRHNYSSPKAELDGWTGRVGRLGDNMASIVIRSGIDGSGARENNGQCRVLTGWRLLGFSLRRDPQLGRPSLTCVSRWLLAHLEDVCRCSRRLWEKGVDGCRPSRSNPVQLQVRPINHSAHPDDPWWPQTERCSGPRSSQLRARQDSFDNCSPRKSSYLTCPLSSRLSQPTCSAPTMFDPPPGA